jgi:anthranilate synthase/aminodeoxychorismate synthase-like glutamine amidotransferase
VKVLLLDNYDSFTFNLEQALRVLGAEVWVHRNDTLTCDAALALEPTHIVISPGPGWPRDAGISMALIEGAMEVGLPLLGVCLGHQAIAEVMGGRVVHAPRLMHGKSSPVTHDGRGVFAGISQPFEAARYHSLIVDEGSLPVSMEVTARTAQGEVMGIRHRQARVEGVQFHPESVLCPEGDAMLANFLAQRA